MIWFLHRPNLSPSLVKTFIVGFTFGLGVYYARHVVRSTSSISISNSNSSLSPLFLSSQPLSFRSRPWPSSRRGGDAGIQERTTLGPHDGPVLPLMLFFYIIHAIVAETTPILLIYLSTTLTTSISLLLVRCCLISRSSSATLFKPRKSTAYLLAYDGNVVGGLIQGVGMAILRSEAAVTIIAAGAGESDGLWGVVGGVLGGLVFVAFEAAMYDGAITSGKYRKEEEHIGRKAQKPPKEGQLLGVSQSMPSTSALSLFDFVPPSLWAIVAFTFQCSVAGLIAVLIRLAVGPTSSFTITPKPEFTWKNDHIPPTFESVTTEAFLVPLFTTGTLLTAAQLLSLYLRGSLIGVTSVYTDLAYHLDRMLGIPRASPGSNSLMFAGSMMLAGRLASELQRFLSSTVEGTDIAANRGQGTQLRALIGGFLTVLGARIAGGCTSGHCLSGVATLSISSFLVVVSIAVGFVAWRCQEMSL